MGPAGVVQPLVVWGGAQGWQRCRMPLLLQTQALCVDGV